MYRLATDPEFRLFSEAIYTSDDIRAAVESIAAGRPWGWRPEPGGSGVMEAVCDYCIIAKAAAG